MARTDLIPAECPSTRRRPRCLAQRPFPSMITATWRGSRLGSRPRIRRASALSESRTPWKFSSRSTIHLLRNLSGLQSKFQDTRNKIQTNLKFQVPNGESSQLSKSRGYFDSAASSPRSLRLFASWCLKFEICLRFVCILHLAVNLLTYLAIQSLRFNHDEYQTLAR